MHVYNVEQSNQGVKKRVYKIDKRFEASIERSEFRYSILQIILAIVMIGIGASFNGKVDKEEICPNGASWWLLTAGLVILGLNVLNVTAKIYRTNVLDHRNNSFAKRCGLEILLISSSVMTIVAVVMIIWGALLVFGSFGSWTYNVDQYRRNMEDLNYCPYTPMMTAFVILIVKLLLLPTMIILLCMCTCCIACLFPSLDSQGTVHSDQVIEMGQQEKQEKETTNN